MKIDQKVIFINHQTLELEIRGDFLMMDKIIISEDELMKIKDSLTIPLKRKFIVE